MRIRSEQNTNCVIRLFGVSFENMVMKLNFTQAQWFYDGEADGLRFGVCWAIRQRSIFKYTPIKRNYFYFNDVCAAAVAQTYVAATQWQWQHTNVRVWNWNEKIGRKKWTKMNVPNCHQSGMMCDSSTEWAINRHSQCQREAMDRMTISVSNGSFAISTVALVYFSTQTTAEQNNEQKSTIDENICRTFILCANKISIPKLRFDFECTTVSDKRCMKSRRVWLAE